MPDPNKIDGPDQVLPEGGNPQNPPVTAMPPIDIKHRFYDQSGRATPISTAPSTEDAQSDGKNADIEPGNLLPEQTPAAPVPETSDKKLYDQLFKSQLYTNSYDDFRKKYNNPKAIDDMYSKLHDAELYTNSKDDFYAKYFNNLPSKEVTDAHDFINSYLTSPKANKAINKITEDQYYKNIYQQQQTGAQGRDATKLAQPIPIRMPDQTEYDRKDFVNQMQSNPSLMRPVLAQAKRQNPADAQKINQAMYVADASKRAHSPATVKYYSDQLASGKMDYDINSKKLVKPVGTLDAIFHGLKSHSDTMDDYDFLTSHDPDEKIKFLDDKIKNYDPDKPVYKAKSEIASMAGSNASAMAKMSAGAIASYAAGSAAPELSIPIAAITTMGMMAGTMDFHHVAYENALEETYRELRQAHPDVDPHVILNEAEKQANVSGAFAMAQGLVAGEVGGKLAKESNFEPVRIKPGFTKALTDIGKTIGKNGVKLVKDIAPDVTAQTLVSGGIKGIENLYRGKPVGEGVAENMGSNLLLMAGFASLRAPDLVLGKEARINLLDGYSKAPPEVIDNLAKQAVQLNAISPETAIKTKQEIEAHRAETEGMPDLSSKITPEAEYLLSHIEETGANPSNMNKKMLEKIANDNGIKPEEGKELSATDIVEQLKNKQKSQKIPNTFVDANDLLEQAAPKLTGTYKTMYEKDPEGFMRFIADQAHGDETNRTELEQAPGITKSLIDAAIAKYPEHILSPKTEANGKTENAQAETGQIENQDAGQQTASSKISVIKPSENKPPNIVNLKTEDNAIPERSATPVHVDETSGNSGQMGEGVPESGQPPSAQEIPIENQNKGEGEIDNPPPGSPEMTGITHAQMDETAREFNMPEYEKSPEKIQAWDEAADKRLREDPDAMSKLITKLRAGDIPDAVEQRMMIKYVSDLKAKIKENPSNELLTQLKRAKDLSNITGGRLVGQSLRARKDIVPVEKSYPDFLIRKMEASGKERLTEAEKKSVKESYDEVSGTQDEYEKRIKDLENKLAAVKADKVVDKTKTATAKKSKKTAEAFKKEREDIWSDIKKHWGESGGQLSATIVPYADRLVRIAPDVARLVKSYLEEGIDNLGEIVKGIHEKAKDIIPEITEKDIHNIIAGEHSEKKQTRNQLAAKQRELREEAKLINRLEDILNGSEPKTEKAKAVKSKKITELRDQIKSIQREEVDANKFYTEDIDVDKTKLTSAKKKIEKQIAEVNEKITKGDFSTEEKALPILENKELQAKFPELYKETIAAKDNLIAAKRKWEVEMQKDEYAKMSKRDKFFDKFRQVTGIRRALNAAFDFSIPFRQGLRITLDPTKIATTAPAFKTMFQHTTSPKAFDRWLYDLENSPDYKNMVEDKLAITNPSELRISKRDEEFMTHMGSVIPGFDASQRAAASWENYVRVDLYRKMTNSLEHAGFTREANPEIFEGVAKLINNLTGRGHMIEPLEHANRLLSTVFWGPRLMASKANMWNPVYFAKMPKEVRKMFLKNMAGVTASYISIAFLLKANGFTIETDPEKTDFLKLKHGDTRYDITGGEAIYLRTFWRVLHAGYSRIKASAGDEKEKKTAIKEADKSFGSVGSFFRNKLAPNNEYVIEALTGKNTIGQPFHPSDIVKIYPLWIDDIKDDWYNDEANSILYNGVPSIFGVGVQTYPEKETKKSKSEQSVSLPKTYK